MFKCFISLLLAANSVMALTWEQITPRLTDVQLRKIKFMDNNSGCIVGDNGTVLMTTNGGASWTLQTVGKMDLYEIHFANADTGYVFGDSGAVYQTTNGGTDWSKMLKDTNGKIKEVRFEENVGYFISDVGGARYQLYKSTNNGRTWSFIKELYEVSDIEMVDGTTIWLTRSWCRIGYSQDSGNNWTYVDTLIKPDCSNSFFQKIEVTDSYLYASYFDQETDPWTKKIYKSTLGADDWTLVFNDSASNEFYDIESIDDENVLFQYDNEIHYTDNGGDTWQQDTVFQNLDSYGDLNTDHNGNAWVVTDYGYIYKANVTTAVIRYSDAVKRPHTILVHGSKVTITNANDITAVTVVTTNGNIVENFIFDTGTDKNTMTVQLADNKYQNGIYIISITSPNGIITSKLSGALIGE